MLSIRSLTRSVPRVVARITSSSIRTPVIRQASLIQSAWKPARTQHVAAFSTTNSRRAAEGEGDEELIAKLDSEIEMENQMKEAEGIPTSVSDYVENGPFEILDVPGSEEVVLTRKFGNETIKVTFNIADLNNLDPESDYNQEQNDEEDEISGEPKNELEGEEGEEGEQDQSFPARLNVVIEKDGKGALAVECVAQDGMIIIDNAYYYANAAHAIAKTPEAQAERQDMYVGPPFGNLDEDLQVLLERYLEERGVNAALAIFVPDYIDMKEQKEYLRWLSNVKSFVEA